MSDGTYVITVRGAAGPAARAAFDDDAQRRRVKRAAAGCPVQAIQLDRVDGPDGSGQPNGSPLTVAVVRRA